MATRAASLPGDGVRSSFEEEWPELARRLERFLAARGVDPWLRADVIQETASRLYPRWQTLDHSLPLWNLAATIAVRVVHNHRRKESRIEWVPEPVPIHMDDVHVRGLQRAQLGKTRSALQQLSSDQRRVLLAEVGEALVPPGTRNRINVLRSRARVNLREALGPWAPAGLALRVRSLRATLHRRLAGWGHDAVVATASMASVAVAATLVVAAPGLDAAGPAARQEVLLPDSRVVVPRQIRDAALLRLTAGLVRTEPRKIGSKAKQRAKEERAGVAVVVQNLKDKAEHDRRWVESRAEYAEGHAKNYAEERGDYAEGRAEYVEGRKDYAHNHAKDYGDGRKQWVEDRLL